MDRVVLSPILLPPLPPKGQKKSKVRVDHMYVIGKTGAVDGGVKGEEEMERK